jgi:hypothetical protein
LTSRKNGFKIVIVLPAGTMITKEIITTENSNLDFCFVGVRCPLNTAEVAMEREGNMLSNFTISEEVEPKFSGQISDAML